MNRGALLAALPTGAAFNAMYPYHRKNVAEMFIGSILDAISSEDREPDNWEAQDIAAAIGYVAVGWNHAALASGQHALTPPEERAPDPPNLGGDVPAARHLRDALDYVRGMPARNY